MFPFKLMLIKIFIIYNTIFKDIKKEIGKTKDGETIELPLNQISNNDNYNMLNIFNDRSNTIEINPILADIYKILSSMRDEKIKVSLGFKKLDNKGFFKDLLHYCALRVLNKYFNPNNEKKKNKNIENLSAEEIRRRGDEILDSFDLYRQLSNTPIENYNEDRTKKIKIDKSIGIFDGTISDIYLPSDND